MVRWIESVNVWFTHWEGIWLFVVLVAGLYYERETRNWAEREFRYDEQKDIEKKQRRTRTKKVTTQPGGASVTEETETVEPVPPEEAANEKFPDK